MGTLDVMKATVGLILLWTAACVSGCTFMDGPKYETMTLEPEQGKGLVVIYRRASVIGDGVRSRVWLNGNDIGKLPIESFITIDVEPGPFDLTIGPKLHESFPSTKVDAHADKVYYIRFRRGVLYDGLRTVDEQMAKEELNGMTHIAHPEDA
jgi:hypothetical protein